MPAASQSPVLEIDGLALLKIITHSHNYLPNTVSGSLLGMSSPDGNGSVECSNSFGIPTGDKQPRSSDSDSDEDTPEFDENEEDAAQTIKGANAYQNNYQQQMLKMMKAVNVDANIVGWYQSMFLGTFCSSQLLETQLSHQVELSDNAVVLLYDPVQTANNAKGEVVCKAFRLTKEFVDQKASGGKNYITPKNVFTEMAVKVKNPGLVRAVLFDLDRSNKVTTAPKNALSNGDFGQGGAVDFSQLDLSTNPFLEKNLEFLSTWVDDLSAEQSKFQLFARTILKEEGGGTITPITFKNNKFGQTQKVYVDKEAKWAGADAPNRLDALLSNLQINTYCDQVNEFADRSFNKMFIAGSLARDGEGPQ